MRQIVVLLIFLCAACANAQPTSPDVTRATITASEVYNDGTTINPASITRYSVYCGVSVAELKLAKSYAPTPTTPGVLTVLLSDLGLAKGRHVCASTITAYQSGTSGSLAEGPYSDAAVLIVGDTGFMQIVPGRGAFKLAR